MMTSTVTTTTSSVTLHSQDHHHHHHSTPARIVDTQTTNNISRTSFAHSAAVHSCSASSSFLTSSSHHTTDDGESDLLRTTTKTPPPPAAHSSSRTLVHCAAAPNECFTLATIVQSFNAGISDDQAWAIIHQSVQLYRDARHNHRTSDSFLVPTTVDTLCLHRDGSVHINRLAPHNLVDEASQRYTLFHLGKLVYQAHRPDEYTNADEDDALSPELESVLGLMTLLDGDDGEPDTDDQQRRHDPNNQDDQDDDHLPGNTTHFDAVLRRCCDRIQPNPRHHYRAVCRALVSECTELQSFLQKISRGKTEQLHNSNNSDPSISSAADGQTTPSNNSALLKFEFSDWCRFWVQVVSELRKGVSLKKHNYSRPSLVFELTPFEILMEDIRSRNFELRKVLVNGDVPKTIKSDAHELILEFIRSRPPLRKAAERKLAPLRSNPTPREQLLAAIRQAPILKHISPPPERRPTLHDSIMADAAAAAAAAPLSSARRHPAGKRRIIRVDMSLFDDDNDDDVWSADASLMNTSRTNDDDDDQLFDTAAVVHRKKKDGAHETAATTTNDHDQASLRRHTIVGCHRNDDEQPSAATPSPRPDSRLSQSSTHNNNNNNHQHTTTTSSTTTTINPLNPMNTMTDEDLAEWTDDTLLLDDLHHQDATATVADAAENSSDRLALSLEEIVHIRSVMTKADLEGLPVGVHVKEEVERKKVCFLCLRTRFKWYGQRGVQCKLCQRIVCSKCYSKIRIPTEHFRNVPVMLLSASLMASPVTASPVHHNNAHPAAPRGLTDSPGDAPHIKTHHHQHRHYYHHHLHHNNQHVVGSAPTTPRKYTTPGHYPNGGGVHHLDDGPATHANPMMTMSTGAGLPLSISRILDVHHESMIVDGVDPHGGGGGGGGNGYFSIGGAGESIMTRSMEGPHSLPPQSPRFARVSSCGRNSLPGNNGLGADLHKDVLHAELASVCIDCQRLVDEIIRSSKQTRSSARNKALRNMTLDLSPVYKG